MFDCFLTRTEIVLPKVSTSFRRKEVLYGFHIPRLYCFCQIKIRREVEAATGEQFLQLQARMLHYLWILFTPTAIVLPRVVPITHFQIVVGARGEGIEGDRLNPVYFLARTDAADVLAIGDDGNEDF